MTSMTTKTVELRARGAEAYEFIRRTVSDGEVVRIGRAPKNGWRIPWDPMISREQADLRWLSGTLTVKCLENARNSIVYQKQQVREVNLSVGDGFRIGGTFFEVRDAEAPSEYPTDAPSSFDAVDDETTFAASEQSEPAIPSQQHEFSADELRKIGFVSAEDQIEVLSNLPELISSSETDQDLAQLIVELLLKNIPPAEAVAVVHYDVSKLPEDEDITSTEAFPSPEMMRVHTREDFRDRFRPSRRLITKTLRQQESMLYIWGGDESSINFTTSEGLEWAFAIPIRGESCQ